MWSTVVLLLVACARCVDALSVAARGSSSRPNSGSSHSTSGVTNYVAPSCVPLSTSARENLGSNPTNRCRSACFTLVVHGMNSSAACLAWNNRSVWDTDICTIAYDRVNNSSLSANREACVIDGVAIPLYPANASVAGAILSVVPWQCPPPPYLAPRPACTTAGLSLGANMAMTNPCFSLCYTVVVPFLTTDANCTEWSNNSHWNDGHCRIDCRDLQMFNESLPNGTCVVDSVALTMYPGVVNVSDDEDLYAVPMPCVQEKICKFSMVVDVSNDLLCAYSTPRFIIMIVWMALALVTLVWTQLMYVAENKIMPAPLALVMLYLLVIGVVWEVGVVTVILGLIGFFVYTACFHKKEYHNVKENKDPAAVQIDGKEA